MHRQRQPRTDDLFLEIADNEDSAPAMTRHTRAPSRSSTAAKHRSLPPPPASHGSYDDQRPGTTGKLQADAQSSRFDSELPGAAYIRERVQDISDHSALPLDRSSGAADRSPNTHGQTQVESPSRQNDAHSRLLERFRSPAFVQAASQRLSLTAASPETQKSHRRLPSTRLHERPTSFHIDSFERKPQSPPESASMGSETAQSTVWDELDELKSRIKKLELTGKLPGNSTASGTMDQGDRPRTATTNPTTIDSSPKRDQIGDAKTWTEGAPAEAPNKPVVSAQPVNTHPLLHSALAKAKPLLKASIFRQLEATAADALQLAALTGSSGQQGTSFSAASHVGSTSMTDRQIRRKVDNMCRNLTDLTLALCEGKHEAPGLVSSPMDATTPLGSSPSLRYSRSSLGRQEGIERPISRLDARRASIFGSQLNVRPDHLGPDSGEDLSASEHESNSHPGAIEIRLTHRSNSRLQQGRLPRYDEYNEDEDLTVRPLSRARTEAGNLRLQGTPGSHRSPSLRESLVARRAHAAGPIDGHITPRRQTFNRATSLNMHDNRRRFGRDPKATPSVIEETLPPSVADDEELDDLDEAVVYHHASSNAQPPPHLLKRRVNSVGGMHFPRRSASTFSGQFPPRSGSFSQRSRAPLE